MFRMCHEHYPYSNIPILNLLLIRVQDAINYVEKHAKVKA